MALGIMWRIIIRAVDVPPHCAASINSEPLIVSTEERTIIANCGIMETMMARSRFITPVPNADTTQIANSVDAVSYTHLDVYKRQNQTPVTIFFYNSGNPA